jgi:hypothetical protein
MGLLVICLRARARSWLDALLWPDELLSWMQSGDPDWDCWCSPVHASSGPTIWSSSTLTRGGENARDFGRSVRQAVLALPSCWSAYTAAPLGTASMDKHALIRALIALLEHEITRATETAEQARAGAVHDEARPENDKDTRALEASYLARGQAQRVVDLQVAAKQLAFMEIRLFGPDDAIALSALIELASDDETRWYLLACAAGGRRIEHPAGSVDVLTPESPLGRALAGRQQGESFILRVAGRERELSIVTVR